MTSVSFLGLIAHIVNWSSFILQVKLFLLLLYLIPSASSIDFAIANGWKKNHTGQIVWRNGCTYSNDVKSLSSTVNISLEECGNQCLNSSMTCNHFHFNHNDDYGRGTCYLYWGRNETVPSTLNSWLETKFACGYIPSQMWVKANEDDRLLVKSNCSFPSTNSAETGQGVFRNFKSFNKCRNTCLEDHRCIAFSYNKGDHKCIIPQKSTEFDKRKGPWTFFDLFRLRRPTSSSSATANCYVVSTRDWEQDANILSAGRVFFKENCDFRGFDIENPTESHPENNKEPACRRFCLHSPQCTHFSFYKNGTCQLKNAPGLTNRVEKNEAGQCGYIPDKLDNWNSTKTGNVSVSWRNGCDFDDLKVIDSKKFNTTVAVCREECSKLDMCNHFSHDGTACYLMFNFELAQPTTEDDKKGWTCGYVPNRIWEHSINGDRRILLRKVCTFPSVSINGTDVISASSFNSCRNACLDDHQCNAFSYDKDERKCIIPHKTIEFESNVTLSCFTELLSSRSPSYSRSSDCAVITSRNWKSEVTRQRNGGSSTFLYQNDCDFTKGNEIENSDQKSYNDCAVHCFDMTTRCTHFTYQEQNGICNLRNAPALTDRVVVKGGGRICGYIPSRWNLTADTFNK